MLKLHHDSTLDHFINKFELNSLFNVEFKKYLELHCFNKDELICVHNQDVEFLYFLVDGSAKSFNDFYSPFSVIGGLEFFNESSFLYNIKALEECICIGIHRDIINDFFMDDIKFLKYFCKNFSNNLSTNSINFIDLSKRKRDVV
ncbi:MAG: hypothetical protein ACRCX2_02170 [Paraclostridium sp.]